MQDEFVATRRFGALVVCFRIWNALFVRTFFSPDEYWQSTEVAHRLVFGYGYLCVLKPRILTKRRYFGEGELGLMLSWSFMALAGHGNGKRMLNCVGLRTLVYLPGSTSYLSS